MLGYSVAQATGAHSTTRFTSENVALCFRCDWTGVPGSCYRLPPFQQSALNYVCKDVQVCGCVLT